MKQNITIEQLNELSEKQRRNLDKYMSLKSESLYIVESLKKEGETTYTYREPLLSIGQMIEFLGLNTLHGLMCEEQGGPIEGELCDALWNAVKEVLEK